MFRKKTRLFAPLALSLALAAAPATFDFSNGVGWSPASAKDGGSGGNSGSGGGGSGSGSSHDGGSSGSGRGSDGGSGSGGKGDSHGEDHGRGRSTDDHRSTAAGARVEVDGDNIEVVTTDGFKQEIENGRFELKDPQGRTVVERRATAEDRARLLQFVR